MPINKPDSPIIKNRQHMKKLAIFACIIALFIQGCIINKKAYWKSEKEKVSHCYKSWQFEDLQTTQHVKVLLYNAKHNQDIYSFPNFLIGVNVEGDTIAVMDKNFEGKLQLGDKITVEPHEWTAAEKEIRKPLLTVRKKSSKNKLYCSVCIVHYGRIKI